MEGCGHDEVDSVLQTPWVTRVREVHVGRNENEKDAKERWSDAEEQVRMEAAETTGLN